MLVIFVSDGISSENRLSENLSALTCSNPAFIQQFLIYCNENILALKQLSAIAQFCVD